MKHNLYAILALAGAGFLLPGSANAQYNLGIATSNWSGTNQLYLNPASIADSRVRFSIDLFSVTAGVDNNLGTLNSTSNVRSAIDKGNINNLFSYSNNATFSLMAPYVNLRLPGFTWSINNKHSVALTNGVRGMNQFNNFDQSLFRTVGDPNYVINAAGSTTALTSKNFNYTAHLWTETGITYAGVVLDKGAHEIRVGATLRYLRGIGYIGLKGNNLDIVYKSGTDSVHVSNSDLEFASNILNTKNAIINGTNSGDLLNQVFSNANGKGIGGDLGVIYDYMPEYANAKYDMDGVSGITDRSRNRYLLRFSASVMDLGAISYRASDNSNANVTGNGYITGRGLADSVKNYEDFRHYAIQHGFTADTSHQNTKVYLPATLRLSVDYHVFRNFYLNAMYVRNLADRMNFGNSYYNQITFTPRFDRKMLSVGLPITYSALTSSYKVGVGFRWSGFFVGSDDILAVAAPKQSGLNVYIGGSVPFFKMHHNDRDGDHISDDEDECPDAYGTRENKGCPEPDSEHGGSADTSDNCPDMPHAMLAHPRHNNTTGTRILAAPLPVHEIPADNRQTPAAIIKNDMITE